jgi:hypothetical protein
LRRNLQHGDGCRHDATADQRTQQEQMILFLRLAKPLLFAVYADFAST